MTDDKSSPYKEGLKGVADTPETIAGELRMMAEGEGDYNRFRFVSPWIKNIWNAAADLIENYSRGQTH